jgi:hypothetical protein
MRAAPEGVWLAFLAVAIQVFLPFLVAFEIAAASAPAFAETLPLCSAVHTSSAPVRHDGETPHHGLSDGCPLCVSLAAGQAFTTPAPILAPIPRAVKVDTVTAAPSLHPREQTSASYNSRAPPL